MQFCQDHWDRLRAKIAERGLSALVPDSGEKAVANLREQLEGEPASVDNFDPLMGSMWAIVSNLMDTFGLVVLIDPGCPLCRANEAHEAQCKYPGTCTFQGFDYMLDRAADDQVDAWKRLGAAG
jgi:hypothetical protein